MNLFEQLTETRMPSLNTDELKEISLTQHDAANCLLDGLSVMGNWAVWAALNPKYPESEAKENLRDLGLMLPVMSEVIQALQSNAINADAYLDSRESEEKEVSHG